MRRISSILILLLFAVHLSAQEKKELMLLKLSNGEVVTFDVQEIESISFLAEEYEEDVVPSFPESDGSEKLDPYSPQKTAAALLQSAGIACTDTIGKIVISPAEYQEIKTFTDNLVAGCKTQKDIHDVCFKWVYSNVKYGSTYSDGSYVNNDPYPVFTKKTAVCQGYSNLLFVMLHSQNVPVLITNGFLSMPNLYGGHAWNYVNCDGKWYVSDPTNNGVYDMSNTSSYSHLFPQSFDVLLFEKDGCRFDFNETRLNICEVLTESRYFATPYSVGGYQVSSFNPTSDLPANLRELFIGKNIETFGMNRIGLNYHGKNIEYIHVDPEHATWRSHKGIVYDKYSDFPRYIPAAMKRIELLPMEKIEKNLIYDHPGVEEIVIAAGTKTIEAWAVENCPNLKVAYIPKGVNVDASAFYGVHPDFKIVYME